MDKDLYIEFLESEIRRILAGANTHYGQSIGWMDEMQDLKLENDRLKQRDDIMVKFIRSVRCIGIICDKCDFHDDSRHCCLFDHGSMSKEVSDLYMVFSDKAEEILERLDNL